MLQTITIISTVWSKGLVKHSWGMKMLAPFWTLTGLKFLVPTLTAFPYYVTKEELTTLTMFYDAYYDFGVIGVFVFSALLGAAAYLLMRMMRQVQNPITYLLYAQFAPLHAVIVFHNLVPAIRPHGFISR